MCLCVAAYTYHEEALLLKSSAPLCCFTFLLITLWVRISGWQRKCCSCCAWIPIVPWPVWPLVWQCGWGQHTVVGSMTFLLAMHGNIATSSMSGPPFA